VPLEEYFLSAPTQKDGWKFAAELHEL